MGRAWEDLRIPEKALEYYQKSYKINKNIFGMNHPKVARDLAHLASVSVSLEETNKAIEFVEEAERILRALPDPHYAIIAITFEIHGKVMCELNLWDQAEECYQYAKKSYESLYGKGHFKMARMLGLLGSIQVKKENKEKALEYYTGQYQMLAANNDIDPILLAKAGL